MTMRVMSRPGRITQPGHIMTIVRNVVSAEAVNAIGRVRMLDDRKAQQQVSLAVSLRKGLRTGHLGQAQGVRRPSAALHGRHAPGIRLSPSSCGCQPRLSCRGVCSRLTPFCTLSSAWAKTEPQHWMIVDQVIRNEYVPQQLSHTCLGACREQHLMCPRR